MRRTGAAVLLLGLLSGCLSVESGPETGGMKPNWGRSGGPPSVPGVQGPYGSKVPMVAPYNVAPPGNPFVAQQMMGASVPMNMVQFNRPGAGMPGMPPTPVPPGGILSPPGMPFAPGAPPPGSGPGGQNVTQASFRPDAGGVTTANVPPGATMPGGVAQAQLGVTAPPAGVRFPAQRTQVRFTSPTGMKVSWFTMGPDGKPAYSATPIETPGRYNFTQAAIYRLKLSNVGPAGLEVYPTMEVVPANAKTEAFLAHSAVPVSFTAADFKNIVDGNYVVKVIYLPDPQFQDVAGTGIEEILSTSLEPGQDPIQEALRRGSILLVIRMGNVDQEAPNTPPLSTPNPNAGAPAMMPPAPFGPGLPALPQVPYLGMPGGGQRPTPPGLTPGLPGLPGLPPGNFPVPPGFVPPGAGAMPQIPGGPGMPLPPQGAAVPPAGPSTGPTPAGPLNTLGPTPAAPVTPPTAPGASDAGPSRSTAPATPSILDATRPAPVVPTGLEKTAPPAPPAPTSGRAPAAPPAAPPMLPSAADVSLPTIPTPPAPTR